MKIVGKVVESCDGDVIYFTDGTAVSADHDGGLIAMTKQGLQNAREACRWGNPTPGTDEDLHEEWE